MIKSQRPALLIINCLVMLGTLATFAGILWAVSFKLRGEIRSQILSRDGELLHPVAVMHLDEERAQSVFMPEVDGTPDMLFAVLRASELKGVIALQLYDADGRVLEAIPDDFLMGDLPAESLRAVREFQPVSRFKADANLNDYFPLSIVEDDPVPLLEVLVPLHFSDDREIRGVARFLLEGEGIEAEFARLDLNLLNQSGIAFASGGAIMIVILGWAFHRIQRSQRLVEDRSARLIKANAELLLAAKTSAIGAVASHLIHGLKNPLYGLQAFVSEDRDDAADDRQDAVESAERMREMIEQVVEVLRDVETEASYSLTLGEIGELVEKRSVPIAKKRDISFECGISGDCELDNRQSNLLLLVLMNLVQNAIDATPEKGRVSVRFSICDDTMAVRVQDSGCGISEAVREHLFNPISSTKEGGTGIGLAISRQLAQQIGAEVSLESTSSEGSCFLVRMPLRSDESDVNAFQTPEVQG